MASLVDRIIDRIVISQRKMAHRIVRLVESRPKEVLYVISALLMIIVFL